MIRLNPAVPDNIFELQHHKTIGDYARTYGDEIARRYENLDIIYFPFFPLKLDLAFLRSVVFPPQLKKIGTADGVEKSLFARNNNEFFFDTNHVLLQVFSEHQLAGYLQGQIAGVNGQIRAALRTLFPRYFSLGESNITWRFTDTLNEGMHVDGFRGGKPAPEEKKGTLHRVKLFVNIDSEPRKWWTSFTTPELLKRYGGQFPKAVVPDADMLTYHISGTNWVQDLPHHEIDIPPMGAVMGEASAITHAVRYGRRLIAAEFFCQTSDMLDPSKQPDNALRGWLADAGIGADPNAPPPVLSAAAKAYAAENAAAI